MSLRRTTSAFALLGRAAAAALNAAPTTAAAHGRQHGTEFKRLATFPAYLNSSIDDAAAAEISTVTEDGRTIVYTDSPGKRLGFVDITDPGRPKPAGTLAMGGEPTSVAHLGHLLLAGVNTRAPEDPEPEYVSVNSRDEAVVSLQENNHIAVVSLASRKVVRHFSAGTVTVSGVDTADDGQILLDGTITAKREPDGVAWLSDDLFASANEGDYEGGTRGWTIVSREGEIVWDAGNTLEHIAVEHGLYPDGRSDAKGIEPENVAFARFGGVPYVFVNAERGNFTAVYDVSNPRSPRFQQLLPTAAGPEGVVAVPSRGLLVVSSETEDPADNLRGAVQVYGAGDGLFPSIVSDGLIPWGTLSALSAVPGKPTRLASVTDSAYSPTRILTIDVRKSPATVVKQLTVVKVASRSVTTPRAWSRGRRAATGWASRARRAARTCWSG